MATQPIEQCTFEEYLEHERMANIRSEYRAGQVFSMAGGTPRHSELSLQISFLLKMNQKCRVFGSDLRLYIKEFDECTYPDAMMICGNVEYWNDHKDVVTNPTVVVEVLSASTQKYDRTTKAGYYRSLTSVEHILLVSQDRISVECWTRHDINTWITKQYESESDILPIGFSLKDIYSI